MTRNRLRSDAYLVSMHEIKIVKDVLDDEGQTQAMNDEIYQIEKNKNWSIVPGLEKKNVGVQKRLDGNG